MKQEWKCSKVFVQTKKAWLSKPRYISSCGGTRSGKTFSNLQLLILVANTRKVTISVVSETMPHLKRGAIRDFQNIMGTEFDETRWNKTDAIYTFPNGSIIEYFSADSPAKVHGPARDILFLNEAQNISYDIARHLFVRTSERILIDYNPTHTFWVNERIEPSEDCVCIHSTFKDNCDCATGETFLSPEQVREIESNKGDKNWWRVYGEGKVGQLEGLIFPDFEQVDDLPRPEERPDGMVEAYGLDFGFTNDPSVLIHVLVDNRSREIWADEVFYRTGMLNSDMAAAMKEAGVGRKTVYADAAEPKTIEELRRYGFNVQPCYKSTRKAEQLQAMKGYRQKITKRSLNLIREHRGYTWQRDKDGSYLNEPISVQDHAEDALRYGCFPALKAYRESRRIISLT
jgi:phage terminase large subunit